MARGQKGHAGRKLQILVLPKASVVRNFDSLTETTAVCQAVLLPPSSTHFKWILDVSLPKTSLVSSTPRRFGAPSVSRSGEPSIMYFDLRKDQTCRELSAARDRGIHVVLLLEPGSQCLIHFTPQSSRAVDVLKKLHSNYVHLLKIKLRKNKTKLRKRKFKLRKHKFKLRIVNPIWGNINSNWET